MSINPKLMCTCGELFRRIFWSGGRAVKTQFRNAVILLCGIAVIGVLSGTLREITTVAVAQEHPFSSKLVVVPQNPFVTNNGQMPPASQYSGPFFKLSHNWPQKSLGPLTNAPWSQAIGGKTINQQNAAAYVAALKQYVSANARQLVLDYANWDADKAHWYTEPWLGSIRESIHGTYSASQFGNTSFPGTGLTQLFDTNVLTYYDERAAYTLYKVWGTNAMKPNVKTTDFQFEEGSVVVKAAMFCSDNPKVQTNWWPVTNGAAMWPLYVPIPQTQPLAPPSPPSVANGYLMQFDIIVKDSVSAPKTGWVFTTLVYDANASGDAWDKMVPLGVMWGNDPGVTTSALLETWINPSAPTYSTQTLGWGGRLSGPNDGARNDIQVAGKTMTNEPDSSCMSCHGPAEWQPQKHAMLSFLLPSFPIPPPGSIKLCGKQSNLICSPAPGSSDWSRWFQDRNGTEPQDPNTGSNATDYDMVFAFKTLPAWWKAMGPANTATPLGLLPLRNGFNQYSGAPLKPSH